jgi:lipopolysaccharide export LptBFGC system permease protein LptF
MAKIAKEELYGDLFFAGFAIFLAYFARNMILITLTSEYNLPVIFQKLLPGIIFFRQVDLFA